MRGANEYWSLDQSTNMYQLVNQSFKTQLKSSETKIVFQSKYKYYIKDHSGLFLYRAIRWLAVIWGTFSLVVPK